MTQDSLDRVRRAALAEVIPGDHAAAVRAALAVIDWRDQGDNADTASTQSVLETVETVLRRALTPTATGVIGEQ